MIVFRAAKKDFSNDLTGKGARLVGGRWNSKGTQMIYTSENIALCMLELAVHIPLPTIPDDYRLVAIEFPDSVKVEDIPPKNLPKDWDKLPYSSATQKEGDLFCSKNKYLVLKVPSAVAPNSYNYLINPNHKDIDLVKIESIQVLTFDPRLFKK